jgi:CHAT domain-containing protein
MDLEDPLLRSGLALAGANRRASSGALQDDGILTAEEVASLDLGGAELVVLSGCDTGNGEIRSGEGVLGLRRAFQVAGARNLVMSLWPVTDEGARSWMTALYQARFSRGSSTAGAVRDASLGQLRSRRKSGQSTHPFYWAGFISVGES